MLKSILLKTAAVSMMFGSFSASADAVIDLFSDNHPLVTAGFIVSSSTYDPDDFSAVSGTNIIGGERDIEVTAGAGTTASAFVAFDELNILSSGNSGSTDNDWTVEVQWDGIDNSATLSTSPGITPAADFSNLQGFSATVINSDGSGSFEIQVHNKQPDNSIVVSTVNLPFLPVDGNGSKPGVPDGPVTFTIPFSLLTPSSDMNNIVAISLKLSSDADTDIRVSAIYAVPAPSSLAVLGLGLLGFAGFARRKA